MNKVQLKICHRGGRTDHLAIACTNERDHVNIFEEKDFPTISIDKVMMNTSEDVGNGQHNELLDYVWRQDEEVHKTNQIHEDSETEEIGEEIRVKNQDAEDAREPTQDKPEIKESDEKTKNEAEIEDEMGIAEKKRERRKHGNISKEYSDEGEENEMEMQACKRKMRKPEQRE
ncbi:CAX-interacting protein 4-like [Penaeus chinensis]|uniref:CAX-interacting protein 4-like n=1 Tax=Penaeus chinensis TaxID=139456 RepID=UPI001FB6F0BA|nr:CAX-interacting protein 4-like [Penaeus chinensis]